MSEAQAVELPEAFSLVLDPPIEAKGGLVTQLDLQEPRARQVRDAEAKLDERLSEASVTDYEMTLVRVVAGVPDEVVQRLPIVELGRAMGYLQGYLDVGLQEEEEALKAEAAAGGIDMDALPTEIAVPIDPPVSWQKVEYSQILLRQPTAHQLKLARQHMKQGVTPLSVRSYQMALVTSVSGLPAAVVDGLRISTLTEAQRHLARFIRAGRQAGRASPAS